MAMTDKRTPGSAACLGSGGGWEDDGALDRTPSYCPNRRRERVCAAAGSRRGAVHMMTVPVRLPEFLCDDCSEGDHEACRHEGGWMYQDTNERCSCHLTGHALDPRRPR